MFVMNPRRRKVLFTVIFIIIGAGVATTLMLKAFNENLLYFFSPTQIVKGESPSGRPFRIGGLVVNDSVVRNQESLAVQFVLTDTVNEITVTYNGILPDLFREGQGIVANGRMNQSGVFEADQVLAKHDENYMPPEVAAALTEAGAEIPSDHLKTRK